MAGQTYMTPVRFGLGGFGIDTTALTQAQLRQKLVQASSMVDAWTNRPMQPTRADLRGGQIVGEQHIWPIPNALVDRPGDRRVFLNCGPIRSIESFKIQFTTTYEINLPPDNLYINAEAGYIELIASQPTIIGYPPLGYWFGLSEPVTTTTYSYGWRYAVADDVLEATDPLTYVASHGNWLSGGDVTVTVDGVEIDPTDYTVRLDDGAIIFDAAAQPGVDAEVLASYTYTLPEGIATACGLIATDLLAKTRTAQRGLLGLQSLRVAEVSMTTAAPYEDRNGISIPSQAAGLLRPFCWGSVG